MILWIKYLPCKLEGLRSNSQHPHKSQVWWCMPVTLVVEQQREKNHWSSLATQASQNNEPQVQQE